MNNTAVEVCKLVLKTTDLTAGSTTTNGTMNTSLSSMTWNNVNMRTVLGTNYDKFDKFNVYITCISTSLASTIGTTDEKSVIVKVSGFKFRNQTYKQSTGTNGNECILVPFTYVASNCVTLRYYDVYFTIDKTDFVDITINLSKISAPDTVVTPSTSAFPQTIFMFDIVGIPK